MEEKDTMVNELEINEIQHNYEEIIREREKSRIENNSDFIKEDYKMNEKIYDDLIAQKNNAKSNTIFNLLDKEISTYISLRDNFEEYKRLSNNRFKFNSKNIEELINNSLNTLKEQDSLLEDENDLINKNKSEKYIQFAKEQLMESKLIIRRLVNVNYVFFKKNYNNMCALEYVYIIEFEYLFAIYKFAVSRNFKDWQKFSTLFVENFSDLILSNIPLISELKSIYDLHKKITQIIDEYKNSGNNYFDEDKRMYEIEKHIEIMSTANIILENIIENVKLEKLKFDICESQDFGLNFDSDKYEETI